MTRRRYALALVAALVATAQPAHAGHSCEPQPPLAAAVERAMTLAQHTAQALDESGADVVLLARSGRDLSKYGLRWSHLGFAYRDGNRWRVVHKLNQCGSDRAALYRQGLGDFFLDDLYRYEAAYVMPTRDVQARLLDALRDERRVVSLNEPAYSMVAYPWAQTYQQSNQWALETFAMAQASSATTRERAQAWLKLQGYEPTLLHLGPLTRLGARLGSANVAFDDHPNDKRFSDRIETVSVDSVFAWLNRSGLGQGVQLIR